MAKFTSDEVANLQAGGNEVRTIKYCSHMLVTILERFFLGQILWISAKDTTASDSVTDFEFEWFIVDWTRNRHPLL